LILNSGMQDLGSKILSNITRVHMSV